MISFSEFVKAIQVGKDTSFMDNRILMNAVKHSQYIDYLERWTALVDAERIHVFLYDDLIRDSSAFMKQLVCRMGLDGNFYDDFVFDSKNVTYSTRSEAIHKIKKTLGSKMPHGAIRDWMKKIYFMVNVYRGAPPNMTQNDLETLKELDAYFVPYNARLTEAFGVDTGKWK
jgi:hypothetical protein